MARIPFTVDLKAKLADGRTYPITDVDGTLEVVCTGDPTVQSSWHYNIWVDVEPGKERELDPLTEPVLYDKIMESLETDYSEEIRAEEAEEAGGEHRLP